MQLVVSWSNTDPDAPAAACDPYWGYVSLLIHADGTDGSTTITNSAAPGNPVFAEGNAQIDTAQSKFGGSSIYFDGSGDYIQLSDHPYWDCSAIDYTMECWVRLTGTQFSTASMLFDQIEVGSNPTSSYGLYLGGPNTTSRNAIGFMYYYGSTLGYFEATGLTIPFDTWHHVAASKSGSTVRLFLNGTLVGTHTLLGTINNGTTSLTLGGRNDASLQYYLTGWMDEIRITSGIARYTADFTPPTEAFPASLCTLPSYALLLHMDGANNGTTFTDSSTAARTVTPSGNAKTSTTQSKFNGSSAYFDGTGDYLSIADTAGIEPGSSDFTLQAWIRPDNVSAGNYTFFSKRADTSVVGPFLLRREGNVLSLKHSTDGTAWADQDTGGTLTANTWHHVALVRSGSSLKVYLDGTSVITQTVSGSLHNNSSALLIGGDTNANQWIGYMDEVVYEMSARWTANFTPPSVPYP